MIKAIRSATRRHRLVSTAAHVKFNPFDCVNWPSLEELTDQVTSLHLNSQHYIFLKVVAPFSSLNIVRPFNQICIATEIID